MNVENVDWVQVIFRWLHIVPVIVLLGSTVFVWVAVSPALQGAGGQAPEWMTAMRKRWGMVPRVCIVLILVSGLYNFMTYRMRMESLPSVYHAFFGIKVLLALGVFFLAEALNGKSAAFAPLRANLRKWGGVSVALGILVVLISGVLRGI
jgi:uncharacterized membrane protein